DGFSYAKLHRLILESAIPVLGAAHLHRFHPRAPFFAPASGAAREQDHGQGQGADRAQQGRHVYAGPTKPITTPHACSGMTSIASSPVLRIPRAGGGRPWSAIHFAQASMLLVR